MKKTILRLYIVLLTLFFGSCGSKKDTVYLQQGENTQKTASNTKDTTDTKSLNYELVIQPDDLLHITVSAENPEVAAPYNLKTVSVNAATGNASSQNQLESYLVDKNGEIEFPQLGKIKVGGLTRLEAVEKLKQTLTDYIQNPSVYLRVVNFKISVLGEVQNPGIFNVSGERITLLEAMSQAGDLTIYGKRKNIMVIREKDGSKTIEHVDLTNAGFVDSPYYYLQQNDVVYVEPNKTRINSSAVGPNITVGLSVLSMAIGIVLLLTR